MGTIDGLPSFSNISKPTINEVGSGLVRSNLHQPELHWGGFDTGKAGRHVRALAAVVDGPIHDGVVDYTVLEGDIVYMSILIQSTRAKW
jgi:hypothetical protein